MPRINTLDVDEDERPHGNQQSDGEDSDEGRQGFFVGGSEHSGQQVLGPNDADRRAQRLFDAVRRAGAEELTEEQAAEIRNENAGSGRNYGGSGYRLGTADDPVSRQPTAAPQSNDRSGPVNVRVILWQNGFSINEDGPLRSFDDPTNRAFLMALQVGQVPPELAAQHQGRLIDLHMERRATPYVAPKAKPFTSGGVRLGGIVPQVVTLGDEEESSAPKLSDKEAKELTDKAQTEVSVDRNKPHGQIQIRQPNGQQLIGEFNETHTIEDVRSYIVASLPEYGFTPFQLHTTYPKRAIEDEKQTVKEAGIYKAVTVMVLV